VAADLLTAPRTKISTAAFPLNTRLTKQFVGAAFSALLSFFATGDDLARGLRM
jgi:hypothetical protein